MQIKYFDPNSIDANTPDGMYAVIANTVEEYIAHRAAILKPEREITLIDPLELPETPDPAWGMRKQEDLPDYAPLLEGFIDAMLSKSE